MYWSVTVLFVVNDSIMDHCSWKVDCELSIFCCAGMDCLLNYYWMTECRKPCCCIMNHALAHCRLMDCDLCNYCSVAIWIVNCGFLYYWFEELWIVDYVITALWDFCRWEHVVGIRNYQFLVERPKLVIISGAPWVGVPILWVIMYCVVGLWIVIYSVTLSCILNCCCITCG